MNESNVDQIATVLKGYKIVGHEFIGPDPDDTWHDETWGRILLEGPGGEKGYLEPSRDPEGNGPGFCFFDAGL